MTQQTNLVVGLQQEIQRNTELLQVYRELGTSGAFGCAMIQAKLNTANSASASGDVVAMLKAYVELSETK